MGEVAALLVTAIYGRGFLIVALHHSEFGIFEFDFLKARVLPAGVLFILLTGVPAVAAARVFRILGLSRRAGPAPPIARKSGSASGHSVLQRQPRGYALCQDSSIRFLFSVLG
jgi:hypothetical protein